MEFQKISDVAKHNFIFAMSQIFWHSSNTFWYWVPFAFLQI
jgi:hypothetical protein